MGRTLGSMDAFAIYTGAGPLAVELASFTANATGSGVTLAWETVSETDNAGFNVYRTGSVGDRPEQVGGSVGDRPEQEEHPELVEGWVKLNDVLIAAAAPGSSQGHSYTFTDATATQGATYWYALEDVALDGTATRHEPVVVTLAEPNAVGLAAFGAVGYAGGWTGYYGLLALAAAALSAVAGAGLRRRRR